MHTFPSWPFTCRTGVRYLLQPRKVTLMGLQVRRARPLSLPLGLALSIALLASVTLLPTVAWAGTIAVDGTTCTLPDAVTAANTDTNVSGCTLSGATPGGADTLNLTAELYEFDGTLLFDDSGPNAMPTILSKITIVGQPAGSTLKRTSVEDFRFFQIRSGGVLTLTNITATNGSAPTFGGGAIHNATTLILENSKLISNTTLTRGGAIYSTGALRLVNSIAISNSATEEGGAIFVQAPLVLESSAIYSNTSGNNGGGIYTTNGPTQILNSYVVENRALVNGGGIYISANDNTTITNTVVASNTARFAGGGFYNWAVSGSGTSLLNVRDTTLFANRADSGGAIMNFTNGLLHVTDSIVVSNSATVKGGGVYNSGGLSTLITTTLFLSNSANDGGSALYQQGTGANSSVWESCIVDNSDVAVVQAGGNPIVATSNWWGAPDGPGGIGPGAGDSVSSNADFSSFKTSPILSCPKRATEVDFVNTVTPVGSLLPGQPVIFTLTIVNRKTSRIDNLFVEDTLPAGFQLTQVFTSGATMVKELNGYRIGQLAGVTTATLHFVGQVDPTLTNDMILNNTATLSSSLTGLLSAQASANVVLPVVNFTEVPTAVSEASGGFEVTLALNIDNPFIEGSVQLVITETTESGTASGVMQGKSVAAVETVIFAPGTTTQQVTVDVPEDDVTDDRTIQLSLQNPARLRLGAEISASVKVSDSTTPIEQPTQIFLPHVEH